MPKLTSNVTHDVIILSFAIVLIIFLHKHFSVKFFKSFSKTHFSDAMCMYFSCVYNDVRTDVINFSFYSEKCSILQFLDIFYICSFKIAPIEMIYVSVVKLGYFQNFFKNALVMLCVCILVT